MSWFVRYTRSSIGAKHVMAVTGLLLLLFAVVHMVGHLQMFGGRDLYNSYARFLQNLWEVKWPVRAGLLTLVIIHIVVAVGLVARNRAARPVAYAKYKPVLASVVGRSMAWTGLAVAAFLAFHIQHFTLVDARERHDAAAMFVRAFQQPTIYLVYLAGMILLAMHLGHGAASWAQSLGWRHPKVPIDRTGRVLSIVLFVGYMLPPTAVLAGVIR